MKLSYERALILKNTRRNLEREPSVSRSLRNPALHTLHLQQTAGDPRRSLSSRLLSTPLCPFRPSALSFPPLSRLTRYFFQASPASILDSFNGEQAEISETKNAFGSIVST